MPPLKAAFFGQLAILLLALILQPTQMAGESATQQSAINPLSRLDHWRPPVPISDLFYSPCNFPTSIASSYVNRHNQRQHSAKQQGRQVDQASAICPSSRQAPFLCDLHRTLSHHSIQSILRVYHKHLPVLRQFDGSSSLFVLIVRQLLQPTSTDLVTKNSTEFGCLFKLPCEPMTPETIRNFVKSTRAFTKIYASALYSRRFTEQKEDKSGCNPRIMALVVLEGVLPNPRKAISVNLHTDNHVLATYITNIQTETTNMLLQGVPHAEVIRQMIDQLGYALKDFHNTRGKFRRYGVPPWAWKLALASIVLVVLSLVLEWAVVRRAGNRQMRGGYELGKIKAVFKSKTHTHMIF